MLTSLLSLVVLTLAEASYDTRAWPSSRYDLLNSGIHRGPSIADGVINAPRQLSSLPIVASPVLSARWNLLFVPTVEATGTIIAVQSDCNLRTEWTTVLGYPIWTAPVLSEDEGVIFVATAAATALVRQGTIWALNASTGEKLASWTAPGNPSAPSLATGSTIISDLKLWRQTLYFAIESASTTSFVALDVSSVLSVEPSRIDPPIAEPTVSWSCVTDAGVKQGGSIWDGTARNATGTLKQSWLYFVADNSEVHGIRLDAPSSTGSNCPVQGAGPDLSSVSCTTCAQWVAGRRDGLVGAVTNPPVLHWWGEKGTVQQLTLLVATSAMAAGAYGGIFGFNLTALTSAPPQTPISNYTTLVYALPTLSIVTAPLVLEVCTPNADCSLGPLIIVGTGSGDLIAVNATSKLGPHAVWTMPFSAHTGSVLPVVWFTDIGQGYAITSGPISNGETVIAGTAGSSVAALQVSTGQIDWESSFSKLPGVVG